MRQKHERQQKTPKQQTQRQHDTKEGGGVLTMPTLSSKEEQSRRNTLPTQMSSQAVGGRSKSTSSGFG